VKIFFRKIFGQETPKVEELPTRPVPKEKAPMESTPPRQQVEPPQLLVGCAQSVGKQRDHNEDALFTLTTTLSSETNNLPFGLYIVADGMGGHQHGEIASGIAVRTMANYIIKKLYTPLLSLKPSTPEESLIEIMQEGVQDAHRAITRQVPGGGTTLTAVLILGNQLTLAHVGDSRAYLVGNNGHMEALTRDHSLVKRLVELGQITTDEAAVHPQRNVLYRALGQGEPFDPDVSSISMPENCYLMLCSDGLWSVVNDRDIQRIIMETASLDQICQNLVDAANAAGGPDNISAILIRLPG
jgi:protein phosphatase